MPELNWEVFAELPGAATTNFEMLCRALVRRHYGQFGNFFALANQPGVEFHLKLHSPCSLGKVGRWYGWQCRWYDLPSGRSIGATRRRKIKKAIDKTEEKLPELTDWVLWTRYPLTAGDQEWFYSLQTYMRLHLWSAVEVEEHLSGPAEMLRGTYFGELVLAPEQLGELHTRSVAAIKSRWQPDVHQVVEAERALRRALGVVEAWSDLNSLAARLEASAAGITSCIPDLPGALSEKTSAMLGLANELAESLTETQTALGRGDYEILLQQLKNHTGVGSEWAYLLRQLKAGRHPVVLAATNMLADISGAVETLNALEDALAGGLVAIVADAGCGKTQLAGQLTAPTDERPAGILLHGRDLHAGDRLDDLARGVVIHGKPVPSFEALVAAVDAAAQRAGQRLPIVIDGLNEAEDPRDWKKEFASLVVTLRHYPHVLVVCTVRSAFAAETLPDGIDRFAIPDFEYDTVDAVRRYFRHYRIDPADAILPLHLLRHPLTLRMFCEVTNPKREQTVGVEAMPGSLSALFDRYLEQVAERIMDLAPRTLRYYPSDVRTALNKIGLALWEMSTRSIDLGELRRYLGDETRPWHQSIVRALENDGVLLRVPGTRHGVGHMTVVYDALAGHLVADSLLDKYGGAGFNTWLHDPNTTEALTGDLGERHPLARDIFGALVGLTPSRMHRRQLWPMLDEPLRSKALYEAAWLDRAHLDSETVSQLAAMTAHVPNGQPELLGRLWTTRAARSHPLDAKFLDAVLRPMPIAARDLRWTEWIRRQQEDVIEDLQKLRRRWRADQARGVEDRLRARWVMWTLTSTVRLLRDHATHALYWFGCADPSALFDLTLESLAVNDPYVPERMLAACYGIAMSLWADPRGANVQAALPAFATRVVDSMFVPGAPYPTRHVLMRDYALGVVSLASRVAPGCIPDEKLHYLEAPFEHLPSPFPAAAEIHDSDVMEAKGAIRMDFGNYTIGRLIPNRRNYDYDDTTYQVVRRQIEHRIVALGYSTDRFAAVDNMIAGAAWRDARRGAPKTDRYGKKYSWIAYFEMYGLRSDKGTLPEWRVGERVPDADIDPSFPQPARKWLVSLPDPFSTAPAEPRTWIEDGPTPDYSDLLHAEVVDASVGPWVLLNGYIEQSAKDDARRIFTFLRGLLVRHDLVQELLTAFNSVTYPGNMAIPEPQEDYYTYAAEIPWSQRFGSALRSPGGKATRDMREALAVHNGSRWLPGIPVEVPVYEFAWESYHSELNQVGGVTVPAPALCEQMQLTNRLGEWDLYDNTASIATVYREAKAEDNAFGSSFLYLRADLVADYLAKTKQSLVWLVWGERGFKHQIAPKLTEELKDLLSNHRDIHRCSSCWEPEP